MNIPLINIGYQVVCFSSNLVVLCGNDLILDLQFKFVADIVKLVLYGLIKQTTFVKRTVAGVPKFISLIYCKLYLY